MIEPRFGFGFRRCANQAPEDRELDAKQAVARLMTVLIPRQCWISCIGCPNRASAPAQPNAIRTLEPKVAASKRGDDSKADDQKRRQRRVPRRGRFAPNLIPRVLWQHRWYRDRFSTIRQTGGRSSPDSCDYRIGQRPAASAAGRRTAVPTSLVRQGPQQSTIDEPLEVSDDTERESSAPHQQA